MAVGDFSPEEKRQESKADQLLPSSAEIKTGGAILPLPHISSCIVLK
jgi:hypothetical protein